MHWEILDPSRIDLLKSIAENVNIGEYYMAGGTALSLQLGLRKSFDFDFFVPHRFNTDALYSQLKEICPDEIKNINIDGRGTCDVSMRNVQVSFFEYPYPTLYRYVESKDAPGLAMASIPDIATMKAIAIGGRGAKKDFFDLYEILTRTDYTVPKLVNDLYAKYGENRDISYIAMALNYFEEAKHEVLPETFVKYDWNKIQSTFANIQTQFLKEIEKHEQEYNREDDFDLER